MIGLESNIITIDIHESKVPLNLQPEFVSIYHDEKLVYSGKIIYNHGNVKIDIGESKKNFENIFESAGHYIPFSFHFLAYSRKTIIFNKGMYALVMDLSCIMYAIFSPEPLFSTIASIITDFKTADKTMWAVPLVY